MKKKRPNSSKKAPRTTDATLPFGEIEALLGDPDAEPMPSEVKRERAHVLGLLQYGPEILEYFSDLYLQEDPNWIKLALWEVVRSALTSLQLCLEAPDEKEITWDNPTVEVQFPAEWNWDDAFVEPQSPTNRAFMQSSLATDIAQSFVRHRNNVALHFLTNRVAHHKTEDKHEPILPPDIEKIVGNIKQGESHALLDRLFQPVAVGPHLIQIPKGKAKDPLPPNPIRDALESELNALTELMFQSPAGGAAGDYAVSLQFHPLVLDEEEHLAYFPVVIGLVRAPSDTLAKSMEPPTDELWQRITQAIDETIDALAGRSESHPTPIADTRFPMGTFTTGTFETAEDMSLRVVPSKTFPLPVGPALIDRGTHQVIGTAIHTRGLFPRWSELPKLEDAINEEARKIYDKEGLEGLRKRKGGIRRSHDGEEQPYLATDARAVKDLMISLGMSTGYRRQERSAREVIASGGIREYACRIFQTPRGYVEVGLAWGYLAGPWVDEWQVELTRRVEAKRKQIEDLQADAAHSLFSDMYEEEILKMQEVVDVASEAIAIWKRGHTLMGLIQGAVYHQKTNWVAIPAEAVRMALWEVEGKPVPPNWKRDVDAVLASLASVSFTVRGLDGEKVKGFGHFLGEVWYEEHPVLVHRGDDDDPPAPPQEVPRGCYLLDVQPGFLGCLNVFQSDETTLNGTGSRLLFNWSKPLSPEDRQVLTGKPAKKNQPRQKAQPYLSFDPARYLAHGAKGLSTSQRALDDCLERELTLNWQRHPGRKLKVLPNRYGSRERLYTHADCPLLPTGQDFVLAGGNGYRPGQSYTIGGSASSKRRGGWLAMVGYFSTKEGAPRQSETLRQFLDDVEKLVEQFYGGVVAGYRNKQWIPLDKLKKMPKAELLRATLRPFLPSDYRERRRQAIRDQGIQVHETAEDLERALGRQKPVVGEVIREARKRKKMTQKDMAELFAVSQAMISQIETNKRPIPDDLEKQLLSWLAEG